MPTASTANAVQVNATGANVPLIVGYTRFDEVEGIAQGTFEPTAAASLVVEPVSSPKPNSSQPAAPEPVDTAMRPPAEPEPSVTEAQPPETVAVTEAATTRPAAPEEPAIGAAGSAPPGIDVRTPTIGATRGDVVRIMDDLDVSVSQVQVQMTPAANQHGYVYTANIEPGPNGDRSGSDLLTVVRQGVQEADGSWKWARTVVEDRTIKDRWHTAPSIAVDNGGFVHVTYNMHNFPWQYKRSAAPHSLDDFVFRGQAVTQQQIDLFVKENRTGFPSLGTAEIPGNQITYPSFYENNAGDLFVTYRHAATPDNRFAERSMSGGISRYDVESGEWTALGGVVPLRDSDYERVEGARDESRALASERGWTVYNTRLMFDGNDSMYAQHFWRNGIAGSDLSRPCFHSVGADGTASELDGTTKSMPLKSDDCGNVGYPDSQGFYSISDTAMNSTGKPHILLSPDDAKRKIVIGDPTTGQWRREESPENATEIFFGADDTLWAVGSNMKLWKREPGDDSWDKVYEEGGSWCFPSASTNEDKSIAYIHTQSCDEKRVRIYAVRLL